MVNKYLKGLEKKKMQKLGNGHGNVSKMKDLLFTVTDILIH
jgi:hypothetical protein